MLIQVGADPGIFYGPVAGLALAVALLFWVGRRYVAEVERARSRAEQEADDWKQRCLDLLSATEKVTDIAERSTKVVQQHVADAPAHEDELAELRATIAELQRQLPRRRA